MGKSNYYDKMEWQDSIKVIITQKLHQIRNWEFHNMLYGMSTIEIIENLIIEKFHRKSGDTTVRMTADDMSMVSGNK